MFISLLLIYIILDNNIIDLIEVRQLVSYLFHSPNEVIIITNYDYLFCFVGLLCAFLLL